MQDSRQRFQKPEGPRERDPFDGVLLVDKPSGPTSHDVIADIRRKFRFRKVGHGGTLDPQATGLLIVLLGRATRQSSHFLGSDKTYEGTLRLGVSTDTQDAEGKILREADCSRITAEQVQSEMKKFTGDLFQTPPMVSAVKIKGVPLYKMARRGEEVERQPRLIHIYEFQLLHFELPTATFRLQCTKGTYVRTLCADIGENLGCGAHLAQLRRLRCGSLALSDAIALDDILRMTHGELATKVIPVQKAVPLG